MARHGSGSLSEFLHASAGRVYDPQHGHSFHRLPLAELSAVQHGRLFFRDCIVCRQRVLSLSRPSTSRSRGVPDEALRPREAPPVATVAPAKSDSVVRTSLSVRRPSWGTTQPRAGEHEVVCQCMDCGNFVHRACLSACHAHRMCRGHAPDLMPRCPQTTHTPAKPDHADVRSPVPELFPAATIDPVIKRVTNSKRKNSASNITIGSLIDALSDDRLAGDRGNDASGSSSSSRPSKATAATVMKRVAPFLAAGGVLGALALGPAAGVIAGLNMLVAGVSVEGMVAGIGVTAATAAATASRQIKKKNEQKRLQEEMKSGAWAMQICWQVKQDFKDAPISDDVFRKDAELLRRFQLPRRTASDVDQLRSTDEFAPTKDEIYALLFGVLSTSNDFLSSVNAQLAKAFNDRFTNRLERYTIASTSSAARKRTDLGKGTLQDARMYVAHLVGATLQTFPSLASTDAAILACSQAVERVVFDDIYKPVMRALGELFADENVAFATSLDDIRRQSDGQHQLAMMRQYLGDPPPPRQASTGPNPDLVDAERKLVAMVELAKSPLHKLELLCSAFRAICCFADALHQTAANADILIPTVCALLVASTKLPTDAFVSQIAFTAFFTDGGGKGVEGYVLTTFQAALQVIAAVDLSRGPAHELAFFASPESSTESSEDERSAMGVVPPAGEDKDDEFFDAHDGAAPETALHRGEAAA